MAGGRGGAAGRGRRGRPRGALPPGRRRPGGSAGRPRAPGAPLGSAACPGGSAALRGGAWGARGVSCVAGGAGCPAVRGVPRGCARWRAAGGALPCGGCLG